MTCNGNALMLVRLQSWQVGLFATKASCAVEWSPSPQEEAMATDHNSPRALHQRLVGTCCWPGSLMPRTLAQHIARWLGGPAWLRKGQSCEIPCTCMRQILHLAQIGTKFGKFCQCPPLFPSWSLEMKVQGSQVPPLVRCCWRGGCTGATQLSQAVFARGQLLQQTSNSAEVMHRAPLEPAQELGRVKTLTAKGRTGSPASALLQSCKTGTHSL